MEKFERQGNSQLNSPAIKFGIFKEMVRPVIIALTVDYVNGTVFKSFNITLMR